MQKASMSGFPSVSLVIVMVGEVDREGGGGGGGLENRRKRRKRRYRSKRSNCRGAIYQGAIVIGANDKELLSRSN